MFTHRPEIPRTHMCRTGTARWTSLEPETCPASCVGLSTPRSDDFDTGKTHPWKMSEKESPIHAEVVADAAALSVKEHDFAYEDDDKLPPPPPLTPEQERKLWRKIDLWLMPMLTLMYLCSFLDRGNIGT